jgi:hypothetical protein
MKRFIKNNDMLRRLYYRVLRAKGQSDEAAILDRLTEYSARTFVEFGFHPAEFNCAALARKPEWQGLLIDGNARQVRDGRALFPERIMVEEAFLTLDNLDLIRSAFPKIGVLSIDVDGNDYWFLKGLIDVSPDVICIEYNSTFGLESITVPYDPSFDRHVKHPSGWYHGASLTALSELCAKSGYGLAAVSNAGGNAFFTRDGMLDPARAWKPSLLRQQYSGVPHDEQWLTVKDLPFERV